MKVPPHPEMTALLKRFNSIYPEKLAYWPHGVDSKAMLRVYQTCNSGQRACIDFLLSVWDPNHGWTQEGFEGFDLVLSVQTWGNRESETHAVISWLGKPFRP